YAIDWKYSLEEGLKNAQDQSKPLMVDFFANWCGYCRKLDSETFPNDQVSSLAEKFVSVKVDTDANQGLSRQYNVGGLPTIVFMDSNAKEIRRVIGYRDAAAFAKEMQEALNLSGK
ncbi:MAG: thioredoxin fold domain-containing protein, partial [Candidatus Omnitrophota bacterium]